MMTHSFVSASARLVRAQMTTRPSMPSARTVLATILAVSLTPSLATSPLAAQVARTTVTTVAQNSTPIARSHATETFSSDALQRAVTLDLRNVTLGEALVAIGRAAGLKLGYAQTVVPVTKRVSLTVTDVSARDALRLALAGTDIIVQSSTTDEVFLIRDPRAVVSGTISGRVTDAKTKQPISGVTISVSGSARTVVTGNDGRFRLANLVPGSHTLTARLLGYVRSTRTVSLEDNATVNVEFALEQSVSALDQVVVTGTVLATAAREVPNAMTVITGEELEKRGITQITQLFRGDIPGLFMQNRGAGADNPLDSVVMFSRGASTLGPNLLDAATQPIKTYVDGIELSNPSFISQIDPRSIERIEIVSGPQASTIYGSNAVNGVMQIFTKRGTAGRIQLNVNLMTGTIENSFRSALTPQHEASTQISGTEGHWSYYTNGVWNYQGAWIPGKQTTQVAGMAGVRVQQGPINGDVSFRRGLTSTKQLGYVDQRVALRESGEWAPSYQGGRIGPSTNTGDSQTLGLTLSYSPTTWWSHTINAGTDTYNTEYRRTAPNNLPIAPTCIGTVCIPFALALGGSGGDTLLNLSLSNSKRTTLRYTTGARIPLTTDVRTTLTGGADGSNSMYSMLWAYPASMTGTLINVDPPVRRPSSNRGAFLQGQISYRDAFFLTYGVRAEWNPQYGKDVGAYIAPKYGASYVLDLGGLTSKFRVSYGRSTKPPTDNQKNELWSYGNTTYGNYISRYAAPDLGPEYQKGWEGGIDLYAGNRGSLTITRYNQIVDDAIAQGKVDSLHALNPSQNLYATITQYLNIGAIRNQGWELTNSTNLGRFTVGGTYSWTKSRIISLNPQKYTVLTALGSYRVGQAFQYLPEHTWAGRVGYSSGGTSVLLTWHGQGYMRRGGANDDLATAVNSSARFDQNRARIGLPQGWISMGPGYTTADLNGSHRFSERMEGVLYVTNLTDFYRNDMYATIATMGRTTKAGLRLRW